MPFRVREVLLVSSPYDAFILEEDGQLTEQVFFEYRDVSLSGPPRVTHVPSGEQALRRLEDQRFDLILVMTSVIDMGVNALARKIKALRPGRPVVLLALDRRELDLAQKALDRDAVDGVFLWSGDSQILLAIIKYFEDRENVDHDIQHGHVRVILVLEDSPRYYSALLGMLYKELMAQSHSLYSEGVNELHRRMYMRSRPKIVHASSYEQGVQLFERYRRNVVGIVSDIRIPRDGVLDPKGGLDFARFARNFDRDLPVLLQSAEQSNAEEAREIGAVFVDKNSESLLADIRDFFRSNLGFGDFIFRSSDGGEEIARASDVRDLERHLAVVPEECLEYHASHNHFSIWLMARSEFGLAERLRPRSVSEFESTEDLRQFLIRSLRELYHRTYRRVISDFNRMEFDRDIFSRIGQGSIGGKARGLAFLNMTLAKSGSAEIEGLEVHIPKSVVITTEYFDEFVESNDLRDFAYAAEEDREISERFMQGRLNDDLRNDLTFVAHHLGGPLAVRSSSLLEDSLHQPLAGIYTTVMIPNQSREPEDRLAELCNAIKLVYASTFYKNAKSYLTSTGHRVEEEKMAVIVQKLVGQRYGSRYYPHFAGVAQSHNFYPIGPQRPEDGVAHIGLGLGRLVVDGGLALRFSPRYPRVLAQDATPKMLLDSTQRGFYALDLDSECCLPERDLYDNIKFYDLARAEEDGTLQLAGSVYSPEDQTIRDDLQLPGTRVVTFNNVLRHGAIPLAESLEHLLMISQLGLGCPVEIEFACDMGDWGKRSRPGRARKPPRLFLLQVRPFVSRSSGKEIAKQTFEEGRELCRSLQSLGHGVIDQIADIVYVRRGTWEASQNKRIATEVGHLNKQLETEGRRYLLIGPGRWGTADPWLGIPVQWSQISSVGAIVEASPPGYDVEPSQGTHFFQNISSLRIGYLTLPAGADLDAPKGGQFLDWEWLDAQSAIFESTHLRHLRLDSPLTIILDGKHGEGVIVKPEPATE
ncbi:MAG: PEP/pyruvate-binding domain-containing protein [Acidobacteriota bacterium]